MPTYFMRNTHLAGLERMMMTPPKHHPRGGGAFVRQHRFTAADCDCRYCIRAEKKKLHCHGAVDCVCFEERLSANCWTHGELAQRLICEIGLPKLTERAQPLIQDHRFPYKNLTHYRRVKSIAAAMSGDLPHYIAAVFLLSADGVLWNKSKPGLEPDSLCFGRINNRSLGAEAQILYQMAKDLYFGQCRLTTAELCDRELISDELFRLIVSAFVIRRYGLPQFV